MKTYRISYRVAEDIWSSNLIRANISANEFEAVRDTARRYADRYGYTTFIQSDELSQAEIDSALRRGMPLADIDDRAVEDYA